MCNPMSINADITLLNVNCLIVGFKYFFGNFGIVLMKQFVRADLSRRRPGFIQEKN